MIETDRQRCRGDRHRPGCAHQAQPARRPGRPKIDRRASAQQARQARERRDRAPSSSAELGGETGFGSPDTSEPVLRDIGGLSEHETPTDLGDSRSPDSLVDSPRVCGHCGASLADRKQGTKYCDSRCRNRDVTGLPVEPKTRRYGTARAHPSYCIEPCARCGFAEADAGYCPDCGQTAPLPGTPGGERLYPAGTCHGPVYGKNGRVVSAPYPGNGRILDEEDEGAA